MIDEPTADAARFGNDNEIRRILEEVAAFTGMEFCRVRACDGDALDCVPGVRPDRLRHAAGGRAAQIETTEEWLGDYDPFYRSVCHRR